MLIVISLSLFVLFCPTPPTPTNSSDLELKVCLHFNCTLAWRCASRCLKFMLALNEQPLKQSHRLYLFIYLCICPKQTQKSMWRSGCELHWLHRFGLQCAAHQAQSGVSSGNVFAVQRSIGSDMLDMSRTLSSLGPVVELSLAPVRKVQSAKSVCGGMCFMFFVCLLLAVFAVANQMFQNRFKLTLWFCK